MIHVVGAGRIGTALHGMAVAQGGAGAWVRRGDPLPSAPGPVVVCTRNDDLPGVVAAAPDPSALVFVQNGAVLPWLRDRGLGENTQGLLYFAVPHVGAPPDPGAPSLFFGPHAPAVVSLLTAAGLPARVLPSAQELANEVAVKLLWAAVFGLLGDLHRETVLASAARREEVAALVAELVPVCAVGLGSTVSAGEGTARVLAYSLALGSWRASVKEWPWRNGWLVRTAAEAGLALPNHAAACARLGLGA
jgi:hypothetical protein